MRTAAVAHKPKPRAKARVSETAAPVAMIKAPTDRDRRLEQVGVRAKVLKALSREFEKIDNSDMSAVVGLIDLLSNREGCEGVIGGSWLATFANCTLSAVAIEGIVAIENAPGEFLKNLQDCIKEFESDLMAARELAERHEEYEEVRP